MTDRAGTRTRADEARAQREFARSRTIRRVAFASVSLFVAVFALLSYRLTAGLDPSSPSSAVTTTTSQPQTTTQSDDTSGESYESEDSGSDDTYESDDGWESQSSSDSSTSTQSQPAPTTGAS